MSRHLHVFLLAVAFSVYRALVVLFCERGVLFWLAGSTQLADPDALFHDVTGRKQR